MFGRKLVIIECTRSNMELSKNCGTFLVVPMTLPSDSLNLQNVTYLEIYGSVVESSDANGRSNVLGMERRDGYVVLCAGSSTFLQQFQKLAQS